MDSSDCAGSFNPPANAGFLFENMSVECMGMETPGENVYNNDHQYPFGLPSFEQGMGIPGGGARNILESYQRLMLPYDDHHEVEDVKPNAKILSLEWHSDAGIKDPFGYNLGGLGSWTGLTSGYGSSAATNPLV